MESRKRRGNAQKREYNPSTVMSNGAGDRITCTSNSTPTSTLETFGEQLEGEHRNTIPSQIWRDNHEMMPATGDRTAINSVVSGHLFPVQKFVDKESQLSYTTEKKSICQFVIGGCNLQPDVIEGNWWTDTAKGLVSTTMNRLRNDRNSAMRKAFLSELSFLKNYVFMTLYCIHLTLLLFCHETSLVTGDERGKTW